MGIFFDFWRNGTTRNSAELGDEAAIGVSLERLSESLYSISRKRLDYTMHHVMPSMVSQFQRDASRIAAWTAIKPDIVAASAGTINSTGAEAARSIRRVQHGLSRYQSRAYQAIAETAVYAAGHSNALTMGLAHGAELERLREWRDLGMDMFYRHIEVFSGYRAIGENLGDVGRSSLMLAAQERMNVKVHELNMQKLAWERDKRMKEIQSAKGNMFGSMIGEFLGGTMKGYSFGKNTGATST